MSGTRPRGRTAPRVALVLIVGSLALWIATAVTVNLAFSREAPALARMLWPAGASPRIVEAREGLANAARLAPGQLDRVRATLRDATLREPLNENALATLAALDDYRGEKTRARALFGLSEAVSRRNTLTQLWLIEDAVARGDIPEAIRHYDRAMRVSFDIRPTLLPVLVQASSDRAVRTALAPVLGERPQWWKDYVYRLGISGDDTATMVMALQATRLDVRQADERILAERALRRMVALSAERDAVLAVSRLEGRAASVRSLQDGSFDGSGAVLPFGWSLHDETGLRAYRDTVPTGGMGLRVATSAGASGRVAQQLVGLAPGRHVLNGVAGQISSDPAARPAIEWRCGNGPKFARFRLPGAPEQGRRFRFAFDVPAKGCDTQWIELTTAPAVDTDMWLDDLAISG